MESYKKITELKERIEELKKETINQLWISSFYYT